MYFAKEKWKKIETTEEGAGIGVLQILRAHSHKFSTIDYSFGWIGGGGGGVSPLLDPFSFISMYCSGKNCQIKDCPFPWSFCPSLKNPWSAIVQKICGIVFLTRILILLWQFNIHHG